MEAPRDTGAESGPIAIVDVHYRDPAALAACVVIQDWTDSEPCEQRVATLSSVLPYRPGAFFERELPCLLAVLSAVQSPFRTVIVDGYVVLDALGSPGLGAHLHTSLGGAVSVVGVAKTAFRGSTFATPVLRGTSRNPLYVTSRGIPEAVAADLVRGMHGTDRVPTLLLWVDHLARGLRAPS